MTSVLGHRSQSLIIGQVVDRGVRAVRGDIARGVVAVGCRYRPGALREPVKSIDSDPLDSQKIFLSFVVCDFLLLMKGRLLILRIV